MSSAEGPAPVAIGGEPKPKSGTAAAEIPKQAHIASSQANRLASLASGGATTFLIGGVAAVVLALFPLRLADRQWQLGVLANLVSNGSWILIGLVLLHLASMLEPRNRALSQRLMLWRRLAALAAVAYLLIVPLQVTITWLGVDASRNERERIISKSETQLKGYRDALMGAPNLTDLKERLGAIPGAPPLPEQASLLPYAEVRKQLLLQLEQAESRLRQRLESLPPPPNTLELGRQTARGAIASLMLALGFASGAEGLFGQASGGRNQFQWIKQWLNLPKRSAIRPISKPRSRALQLPLQLKIPRQWQFWSKRFWRKKKRSSRRRIRESR
ncbi:MAG: hypothetical protein RLZZ206_547 [Cyanobacteriota bacterium]|jgi:hypothetical protein